MINLGYDVTLYPNSSISQELDNNDYSLLRLCNLCVDITMVGQIQAHQQSVLGNTGIIRDARNRPLYFYGAWGTRLFDIFFFSPPLLFFVFPTVTPPS